MSLYHKGYGEEPFLITEFLSNKEKTLFIKNVERFVRTSDGYNRWLTFIHGVLGLEYICYYSGENEIECKIEVHHYPLSLYNIADMYITNHLENGISPLIVANDILLYHFKNMIGFVLLTKSNHEKCHNGVLQIPIEIVEGNWESLLNEFKVIPDNIMYKITNAKNILMKDIGNNWYVKEKKYLNVEVK